MGGDGVSGGSAHPGRCGAADSTGLAAASRHQSTIPARSTHWRTHVRAARIDRCFRASSRDGLLSHVFAWTVFAPTDAIANIGNNAVAFSRARDWVACGGRVLDHRLANNGANARPG